MFLKRNIFTILFAICCISINCCSQTSATYCSLDIMKEHAMDACEHLYSLESEVRERRSLDHHPNNHKHYKKLSNYLVHISRSSYPKGGYLKVNREHYDQLSRLDVRPRYKPTKFNLKHEMSMRKKREDKEFYTYGNNIAFCCINKCEEEFFC